ncbi:hypothetical protein ACSSS7_001032 [Eimeria intestinalis]
MEGIPQFTFELLSDGLLALPPQTLHTPQQPRHGALRPQKNQQQQTPNFAASIRAWMHACIRGCMYVSSANGPSANQVDELRSSNTNSNSNSNSSSSSSGSENSSKRTAAESGVLWQGQHQQQGHQSSSKSRSSSKKSSDMSSITGSEQHKIELYTKCCKQQQQQEQQQQEQQQEP